MHKKLVIDSFEKAKATLINKSGIIPSVTRVLETLSDYLYNNKTPFSYKSLETLYRTAIKNSTTEIKQPKVVNALCNYMGYKDYVDFYNKNKEYLIDSELDHSLKEKVGVIFKKNKIRILIISVILFVLLIGSSINQPRWMVWNNDHYIEVNFDLKKYDIGELKVYRKERIKYFKKIKANCEVEFFDKSGDVKIWYGKNRQSDLELFTSIGLHPETGKTLKPITKYMIKKYFCQNYK